VILLAEMALLISTGRNRDRRYALIYIKAAAGKIGDKLYKNISIFHCVAGVPVRHSAVHGAGAERAADASGGRHDTPCHAAAVSAQTTVHTRTATVVACCLQLLYQLSQVRQIKKKKFCVFLLVYPNILFTYSTRLTKCRFLLASNFLA
jgi:hypothetical protein